MNCNLCGLTCDLGPQDRQEGCSWEGGLLGASVMGGYESTPGNGFGALDDCTSYGFSMCEFCLDWLFEQFRVPVKVQDVHIDDPDAWRPAAKRVTEDEWRTYKHEFFAEKNRRDAARRGLPPPPKIPFPTTPAQQEDLKGIMSYLRELFYNTVDRDPGFELVEKAGKIAMTDQGVYDLLVMLRESVNHNDWSATLADVAAAVHDYESVPATK